MKKIKVRVPSGRIEIRVRKEKVGIARCANCKRELHGMPRLHPAELRKLAKTERKPSRAYGGYFCADCTREFFRERARAL